MENNIIAFLNSSLIKNFLFGVKILFIIISLFFFIFIIVLTFRTKWIQFRFLEVFTDFFFRRPYGTKKITKQWQKIKLLLETGLESDYKLAVIEADAILEEILKKLGYPGETMSERLEKINENILPSIKEVRMAHQVRNNIVHDPDYKIDLKGAQSVIAIYEKSLIDLGVL